MIRSVDPSGLAACPLRLQYDSSSRAGASRYADSSDSVSLHGLIHCTSGTMSACSRLGPNSDNSPCRFQANSQATRTRTNEV